MTFRGFTFPAAARQNKQTNRNLDTPQHCRTPQNPEPPYIAPIQFNIPIPQDLPVPANAPIPDDPFASASAPVHFNGQQYRHLPQHLAHQLQNLPPLAAPHGCGHGHVSVKVFIDLCSLITN